MKQSYKNLSQTKAYKLVSIRVNQDLEAGVKSLNMLQADASERNGVYSAYAESIRDTIAVAFKAYQVDTIRKCLSAHIDYLKERRIEVRPDVGFGRTIIISE